jgi:hypothetical protein
MDASPGVCLLSGWGAVHYAAAGGEAVLAWMYRATGGRHHLAAALRAHRTAAGQPPSPPPSGSLERSAAQWLADAPPLLVERVVPLLIEGERVLGLLRTRELWPRRPRRATGRTACLSPEGLLVATERGLLVAERVAAERRSPLAGGVRCLAIPWDCVTELKVACATGVADTDVQHEGLLLRARRGTAAMERWFATAENGGGERERFLAAAGSAAPADASAIALATAADEILQPSAESSSGRGDLGWTRDELHERW